MNDEHTLASRTHDESLERPQNMVHSSSPPHFFQPVDKHAKQKKDSKKSCRFWCWLACCQPLNADVKLREVTSAYSTPRRSLANGKENPIGLPQIDRITASARLNHITSSTLIGPSVTRQTEVGHSARTADILADTSPSRSTLPSDSDDEERPESGSVSESSFREAPKVRGKRLKASVEEKLRLAASQLLESTGTLFRTDDTRRSNIHGVERPPTNLNKEKAKASEFIDLYPRGQLRDKEGRKKQSLPLSTKKSMLKAVETSEAEFGSDENAPLVKRGLDRMGRRDTGSPLGKYAASREQIYDSDGGDSSTGSFLSDDSTNTSDQFSDVSGAPQRSDQKRVIPARNKILSSSFSGISKSVQSGFKALVRKWSSNSLTPPERERRHSLSRQISQPNSKPLKIWETDVASDTQKVSDSPEHIDTTKIISKDIGKGKGVMVQSNKDDSARSRKSATHEMKIPALTWLVPNNYPQYAPYYKSPRPFDGDFEPVSNPQSPSMSQTRFARPDLTGEASTQKGQHDMERYMRWLPKTTSRTTRQEYENAHGNSEDAKYGVAKQSSFNELRQVYGEGSNSKLSKEAFATWQAIRQVLDEIHEKEKKERDVSGSSALPMSTERQFRRWNRTLMRVVSFIQAMVSGFKSSRKIGSYNSEKTGGSSPVYQAVTHQMLSKGYPPYHFFKRSTIGEDVLTSGLSAPHSQVLAIVKRADKVSDKKDALGEPTSSSSPSLEQIAKEFPCAFAYQVYKMDSENRINRELIEKHIHASSHQAGSPPHIIHSPRVAMPHPQEETVGWKVMKGKGPRRSREKNKRSSISAGGVGCSHDISANQANFYERSFPLDGIALQRALDRSKGAIEGLSLKDSERLKSYAELDSRLNEPFVRAYQRAQRRARGQTSRSATKVKGEAKNWPSSGSGKSPDFRGASQDYFADSEAQEDNAGKPGNRLQGPTTVRSQSRDELIGPPVYDTDSSDSTDKKGRDSQLADSMAALRLSKRDTDIEATEAQEMKDSTPLLMKRTRGLLGYREVSDHQPPGAIDGERGSSKRKAQWWRRPFGRIRDAFRLDRSKKVTWRPLEHVPLHTQSEVLARVSGDAQAVRLDGSSSPPAWSRTKSGRARFLHDFMSKNADFENRNMFRMIESAAVGSGGSLTPLPPPPGDPSREHFLKHIGRSKSMRMRGAASGGASSSGSSSNSPAPVSRTPQTARASIARGRNGWPSPVRESAFRSVSPLPSPPRHYLPLKVQRFVPRIPPPRVIQLGFKSPRQPAIVASSWQTLTRPFRRVAPKKEPEVTPPPFRPRLGTTNPLFRELTFPMASSVAVTDKPQ